MDTANADTTWTRKWLGLLDEGVSVGVNTSVGASTSPVVFSSQASTPLHPNASEDADQPSGLHSPSSSSTDLSDDAGLTYSDEWRDGVDVKGKGRAKPGDQGQDLEADEDEGPRSLPTELVMQIMQLHRKKDLVHDMRVSKQWCLIAFPILWQKPSLSSIDAFRLFVRVLREPEPLLPYSTAVKRLVFNGFSRHIDDDSFEAIGLCQNLERLTLPGASRLSSKALISVFGKLQNLIAVDLWGVEAVNDQVVSQIATSCPKIQGLNLAQCNSITDEGILAVAAKSAKLRRIKLTGCRALTDRSIVALTRSCPLLLELDLGGVIQLTNDSLVSIFLNSSGLRELRVNEDLAITPGAIPHLATVSDPSGSALVKAVGAYPWYVAGARAPKAEALRAPHPEGMDLQLIRPVSLSFDQLRAVDFTNCRIGDDDIEALVANAPQMRSVTLAKCSFLTDDAVYSIARLGKQLHYLHLGHVSLITDEAVITLARSCTRLRYLDLANCMLLTDLSVGALSTHLCKLRRIGLVKVVNVTDKGITALAERRSTLERLHLSYCENITPRAVSYLLNRLPLLTHLSLTGISAFKTPELQQFSRKPPGTFTPHQSATFCVYSGSGVNSLRSYLASRILEEDEADEFFINHEPEADTWDPQASWVSGGTDGPNEANGNGHGHYDPVPHAAAEPSSRGRQARDAQQRLV